MSYVLQTDQTKSLWKKSYDLPARCICTGNDRCSVLGRVKRPGWERKQKKTQKDTKVGKIREELKSV